MLLQPPINISFWDVALFFGVIILGVIIFLSSLIYGLIQMAQQGKRQRGALSLLASTVTVAIYTGLFFYFTG